MISEPPHNFVVNVDRASYVCGSDVLVTGKLWAAMGSDVMIPGATVIFEIHTPSGSVLGSGSSTTDSLGIATFRFTLPSTCETGTYVVFASTTFASIVQGAPDVHLATSTNFTVTNPYWFAVSVDRTSYVCGSSVLATAVAQLLLGSPAAVPGATVIFEIHTPSGSVLGSGSSTTDSLGIATFRFTLPSTCETGTYVVFASTTFASIVQGAPDVHLTSSTNIPVSNDVTARTHVTINLSTTDSNGNPKSAFTRGETVLVKITVTNDGTLSLSNVHILLTIYDPNNVPIFFGISIASLNAGQQQTQLFGTPLGSTLPAGTFRGEVVALSDFLASGGHYVPDGSGAVTFVVT